MNTLLKSALFTLIFAQMMIIAPPPGDDSERANESESLLACGGCRE